MGAGDAAKFMRSSDPDKAHEIANDRLIDAARAFIPQIGEPFIFGRDGRKGRELRCRKLAGGGERKKRFIGGHGREFSRGKSYFQE